MSLHWYPLPHLDLPDNDGVAELALNVILYGFTAGIVGSLLWLAVLAWTDRA